MMIDPDQVGAELLRAYADAHTPDREQIARLSRRLARSRGVAPRRSRARSSRTVVVVGAFAIAAALVAAVARVTIDSRDRGGEAAPGLLDFDFDFGERAPDDVHATPREAAPPAAPAAADLPMPPTEIDALVPVPTQRVHDSVPAPSTSAMRRRDAVQREDADEVDPVAAEAAAIRTIDAAVRAGDVATARRELASYRRTFTAGLLHPQAEALAVIADCGDDAEGARGRARALLDRRPDAAFARRVREACGLEHADRTELPIRGQP